jgi:glycosyltransferase involved in cell wall biosynthesis
MDADRLRLTLLNLYDRHGGAERCLNDLRGGLAQRGHEVSLAVGKREPSPASGDNGVYVLRAGRLEWLVQKGLHRLLGLTDTLLWSPFRHVLRHPAFVAADVVHIHNLHGGYFNLWALPLLARRRPLVITLHDMWLLTGDCVYSGECERWQKNCGACPSAGLPRLQRGGIGGGDLTRVNIAIKRTACGAIPRERLVIVTPSRWLADCVAKSHLRDFPTRVIPYGIDLTAFAPLDQQAARRALGLPADGMLLAAVAANWDNPHKGGDLLRDIAAAASEHKLAQVVVAGRMSVTTRQALQDRGALVLDGFQGKDVVRQAFSACDAALVLSKEENLPFVIMEALACGCPPLARGVGGIPEMFESGRDGWLMPASARAEDALACLRQWHALSADQRRSQRQAARRRAEQCYALVNMLDAYEDVYRAILTVKCRRAA